MTSGEQDAAHHNVEGATLDNRRDIPNPPAEGISYYTPAQKPIAGTAFEESAPKLFQPLKIKGLEMQNRVMVCFKRSST